jgi:hypothetical protein
MARALIHGLPDDGMGCQDKGDNERPYPHHMTLTLMLLGTLGCAVAVFGGVDGYRGRIKEDSPGSGFFTIPEHQGRSLALTIAGALISLLSLFLSLTG